MLHWYLAGLGKLSERGAYLSQFSFPRRQWPLRGEGYLPLCHDLIHKRSSASSRSSNICTLFFSVFSMAIGKIAVGRPKNPIFLPHASSVNIVPDCIKDTLLPFLVVFSSASLCVWPAKTMSPSLCNSRTRLWAWVKLKEDLNFAMLWKGII